MYSLLNFKKIEEYPTKKLSKNPPERHLSVNNSTLCYIFCILLNFKKIEEYPTKKLSKNRIFFNGRYIWYYMSITGKIRCSAIYP